MCLKKPLLVLTAASWPEPEPSSDELSLLTHTHSEAFAGSPGAFSVM